MPMQVLLEQAYYVPAAVFDCRVMLAESSRKQTEKKSEKGGKKDKRKDKA